jgi:hypothetical protein
MLESVFREEVLISDNAFGIKAVACSATKQAVRSINVWQLFTCSPVGTRHHYAKRLLLLYESPTVIEG